MRWLLLFGLMLVAAGVAWYSVAVFIPMLKARAARPAAITIAVALSFLAVLALSWVSVVPGGVWLVAGLAPWLAVAATPDTLVRITGGPRYVEAPADHAEILSLTASVRASAGAP